MEEKKTSIWVKVLIALIIICGIGFFAAMRNGLVYVDIDEKLKIAEIDSPESWHRDQKRIIDLDFVSSVVSKYFEKYQRYPNSLQDVLPEKNLFGIIPEDIALKSFYDPVDKELYVYYLSNDELHYYLGASLESLNNTDFSRDADGVSYSLPDPSRNYEKDVLSRREGFGDDAKGCKGEYGRHCFDYAF